MTEQCPRLTRLHLEKTSGVFGYSTWTVTSVFDDQTCDDEPFPTKRSAMKYANALAVANGLDWNGSDQWDLTK